jgi:hypothetical protein
MVLLCSQAFPADGSDQLLVICLRNAATALALLQQQEESYVQVVSGRRVPHLQIVLL